MKGIPMTRIPGHTIEDAPEAARPLLEDTAYFLNYAATELDIPGV
jgi:hypothetical protein